MAALVDVQDRIESLERMSRLHAQTISAQQVEHKSLYENTKLLDSDITKYKVYVEGRFSNLEQCTSREIDKINIPAAESAARIIDMEVKVGMIAAQMASLLETLQPDTGAQPRPRPPGIDQAAQRTTVTERHDLTPTNGNSGGWGFQDATERPNLSLIHI